MKQAKYLGGSWVDQNPNFYLTIGELYQYEVDSGAYRIITDTGRKVYIAAKFFEEVQSHTIEIDKDDIIKTLESVEAFMQSLWCRVDQDVWEDLYIPKKLVRETLRKLNQ